MLTQPNATTGQREVYLMQGEFKVSGDEDVVFSTLLGSCVATCLHDPVAKVGGLNHFLLPSTGASDSQSHMFGVNAMEMLINSLLRLGAEKSRLQAKLFGGAAMNKLMATVGEQNSKFALSFLADEGIPCIAQSLGGTEGRKIRYVPTTGIASQRLMSDVPEPAPAAPAAPKSDDDILFFED